MKEQVRSALIAYRSNYPTLNRAAESLQGVSSATVSQLCNGKYELISDEMFVRIATQIGFAFDSWNLHEGKTFKEITFTLSDAQAYKNVTWIVGDAGCGKTTAAIEYRRTHRNVFYILCSEDMRRSDFVREIAKQVGAPTDTTNLRDMLENAISMISFLGNPLLVFDEGDKLTDSVFNYFISIYNRWKGTQVLYFSVRTISSAVWKPVFATTRKVTRKSTAASDGVSSMCLPRKRMTSTPSARPTT